MVVHKVDHETFLKQVHLHRLWGETLHHASSSNDGKQMKLQDTTIVDVSATDMDINSAEFIRCTFLRVHFENCDLTGAVFIDCTFQDSSFNKCSLVKADFRGAQGSSLDLSSSNLTRADLTDAKLFGANLTHCKLNWAWLNDTDLRQTILDNTNFEGTRLAGTKIYNSKKFRLINGDKASVVSVDISPQGDGSYLGDMDDFKSLQA